MEFNGRSPQLKYKIMKMKEELSPETTADAKQASSANDRNDSLKIARLLRGGNYPLAYVYPAGMRAT